VNYRGLRGFLSAYLLVMAEKVFCRETKKCIKDTERTMYVDKYGRKLRYRIKVP